MLNVVQWWNLSDKIQHSIFCSLSQLNDNVVRNAKIKRAKTLLFNIHNSPHIPNPLLLPSFLGNMLHVISKEQVCVVCCATILAGFWSEPIRFHEDVIWRKSGAIVPLKKKRYKNYFRSLKYVPICTYRGWSGGNVYKKILRLLKPCKSRIFN